MYPIFVKILAKNRRATHDYEITDTVEAGIRLTGQEVKSARQGHMNLKGAYVIFQGSHVLLRNATIAPYSHASGLEDYNPGQERELLLTKKEAEKLQSLADQQGVTVLPLEVRGGRYIKVLLGLGRGLKRYDKRQKKKEKDIVRRVQQGREY